MPWICQLHGEVRRVRKSGVSLHCSKCKHRVEFRPSPLELLVGTAEVRQAWSEEETLRRAGMPIGERVETQVVNARLMEMDG